MTHTARRDGMQVIIDNYMPLHVTVPQDELDMISKRWIEHRDPADVETLIRSQIRFLISRFLRRYTCPTSLQVELLGDLLLLWVRVVPTYFDPARGRLTAFAARVALTAFSKPVSNVDPLARAVPNNTKLSALRLWRADRKWADRDWEQVESLTEALREEHGRAYLPEAPFIRALQELYQHTPTSQKPITDLNSVPANGADCETTRCLDAETAVDLLTFVDLHLRNILTEREYEICQALRHRNRTLAEVGKHHGISRERVRQIHSKAIDCARNYLIANHAEATAATLDLTWDGSPAVALQQCDRPLYRVC